MREATDSPGQWQVVSASVRGSAHASTGQANQDCVAWRSLPGEGVVIAVSDGHGSDRSPRSDRGSQFAVEGACGAAEDAFRDGGSDRDLAEMLRSSILPMTMERWRTAVRTDLLDDPAGLSAEDTWLLYGATLLIVVATREGIAAAQVGDGDIIVVRESGHSEHLIPPDDRFVAGETPSLCLDDALSYARFASVEGTAPHLLVLATDGYGNSFADRNWVAAVGVDLLEHLQSKGLDWMQQRLETWLADSARVAGDDVTVALLAPAAGARQTRVAGGSSADRSTVHPVPPAAEVSPSISSRGVDPTAESASSPHATQDRSARAPAMAPPYPPARSTASARHLILVLGLIVMGLVAGFVLGRATASPAGPTVPTTPNSAVETTVPSTTSGAGDTTPSAAPGTATTDDHGSSSGAGTLPSGLGARPIVHGWHQMNGSTS